MRHTIIEKGTLDTVCTQTLAWICCQENCKQKLHQLHIYACRNDMLTNLEGGFGPLRSNGTRCSAGRMMYGLYAWCSRIDRWQPAWQHEHSRTWNSCVPRSAFVRGRCPLTASRVYVNSMGHLRYTLCSPCSTKQYRATLAVHVSSCLSRDLSGQRVH